MKQLTAILLITFLGFYALTADGQSRITRAYNNVATTFLFTTDNAYDIGGTSTGRPRDLNLGRNAIVAGTLSVTGHDTVEGVTSTGATGTGKFVFDASPTITGHETIEGVAATGATGTGKFVFDTSPTFTTSAIAPLFRSTAAKVLLQGTGTGPTQIASTQTTVPTCSSNCGTSPSIVGSDSDMLVTMGATGSPASGWVVSFNGTWAAAPSCAVQMAKAGMVVGKQVLTAVASTTIMTAVTNGTAPGNADVYAVICRGIQ